MTKLCGSNVSDRRLFQEEVRSRAREAWKENGTVTEKWLAIRSALTGAAESILGIERRRYPDWYTENACRLEPYSRGETTSTPNGLPLVGNLIDKILPRHVVRHDEQSEK